MLGYIPSPHSGVVDLGPVQLHLYGLTLLVAILACIGLTGRRWVAKGGEWDLVTRVAVWGVAFGVVGRLFAFATHALTAWFRRVVRHAPLQPVLGGAIVAVAATVLNVPQYLGLGIPTIEAAFHGPLPAYDFAGKFAFTVVTLASGFKGGEVTPLFYIGATLGNALGQVLALPVPVLAGLGFVAVFAGAANTPIASTIMAIELFGADVGVYAIVACVVAYLFSGHAGIYRAQRVAVGKGAQVEVE